MKQQKVIGVIGAGACDAAVSEQAFAVGAGLAAADCVVVCGGLGGVMEAACRGAKSAGGMTVGILPDDLPDNANPWVDIAIATGMGVARNSIIVRSARALIAVSGGPGTLSEIAFALQLGVPVVSLGSWDVSDDIVQVDTPQEAVETALSLADARR